MKVLFLIVTVFIIATLSTLPASADEDAITRGRDIVDQYRNAHGQLYDRGYYKGISADHTPLIATMVAELEKEGFTSAEKDPMAHTADVINKFFEASDDLNVKELGYRDLEEFKQTIDTLLAGTSNDKETARNLILAKDAKWK